MVIYIIYRSPKNSIFRGYIRSKSHPNECNKDLNLGQIFKMHDARIYLDECPYMGAFHNDDFRDIM